VVTGWRNGRRRKSDYRVIGVVGGSSLNSMEELVGYGYLPEACLAMWEHPSAFDRGVGLTYDVELQLHKGKWKIESVYHETPPTYVERGWHCRFRLTVLAKDELDAYLVARKIIESTGEQVWTG